eukprot:1694333-Pleurochrysis_carterae.AAC.1
MTDRALFERVTLEELQRLGTFENRLTVKVTSCHCHFCASLNMQNAFIRHAKDNSGVAAAQTITQMAVSESVCPYHYARVGLRWLLLLKA